MIIDATFWVAISFLIFVILLIYFKIPLKVKKLLDDNISQIRKQVDESENLKEEAKKYAKLLGYNFQSSQWYENTYAIFNKKWLYGLKHVAIISIVLYSLVLVHNPEISTLKPNCVASVSDNFFVQAP